MIPMMLFLATLAHQGSMADFNRDSSVTDISSIKMKLLDTRREARCPQCQGDVDEDYHLSFSKRCQLSCFSSKPAFIAIIERAKFSTIPCEPYKVGKIVIQHSKSYPSIVKIDYTGKCISIEAVDYRTDENLMDALLAKADIQW